MSTLPDTRRDLKLLHIVCLLAAVGVGCDRSRDWWLGPGRNIDVSFTNPKPNRLVIDRSYPGRTVRLQDTQDPQQLSAVIELFQRHPDGWLSFSGVFGDYDIYLYTNDRVIERLGIKDSSNIHPGKATLNVGGYFRRVPAEEAATLASRLGLPWPPK